VVTRAPEQAGELVAALNRLGAEVLLLPTVRFAPPEDWRPVDEVIARVAEFDWIVWASQNAVRFFAQRRRDIAPRGGSTDSQWPRIAAVGPATAAAATKEGLRVDCTATKHTGRDLAQELASAVKDQRVLLPRSDRGDERLPVALREAGAVVSEVVVYRTIEPEPLDAQTVGLMKRGEVDAILFASPSAFLNLCDVIPAPELARLSDRVRFAAIGPTTARALREAGLRVEIESAAATAPALADAIASYYERQTTLGRRT
jgi:uroporphyrinogen-III synthase